MHVTISILNFTFNVSNVFLFVSEVYTIYAIRRSPNSCYTIISSYLLVINALQLFMNLPQCFIDYS